MQLCRQVGVRWAPRCWPWRSCCWLRSTRVESPGFGSWHNSSMLDRRRHRPQPLTTGNYADGKNSTIRQNWLAVGSGRNDQSLHGRKAGPAVNRVAAPQPGLGVYATCTATLRLACLLVAIPRPARLRSVADQTKVDARLASSGTKRSTSSSVGLCSLAQPH